MSLLDFLNPKDEAQRQGLLALGIGMMQPTRSGGFGESLGNGFNSYQRTVQNHQNSALDRQMMQHKIEAMNEDKALRRQKMDMEAQKQTQANELRKLVSGILSPNVGSIAMGEGAAVGDVGPTVGNAARYDQVASRPNPGLTQQTFNALSALDPKMAKTLLDGQQYFGEPRKLEQGAMYESRNGGPARFIPKVGEGMAIGANGAVSAVPGYLSTNSAIEAARAAAIEQGKQQSQFGFQTLEVPGEAPGSTKRVFTADVLPTPPGMRPQMTPRGQAGPQMQMNTPYDQRKQEQIGVLQSEFAREASRVPSDAADALRKASNLQSLTRELRMHKVEPQAPESQAPQTQRGVVTNAGSLPVEAMKLTNEDFMKNDFRPAVEGGRNAAATIDQVRALRNIDLKTGFGTEAKAAAANVLMGLGIAPESAKKFATNAQIFQQQAMSKLMTEFLAQKGTQTEGDAKRAQLTFAQLQNTPQANEFILDITEARANMQRKKAEFYERALPIARGRGDLGEVAREWRKSQMSMWDDPAMQKWIKIK